MGLFLIHKNKVSKPQENNQETKITSTSSKGYSFLNALYGK